MKLFLSESNHMGLKLAEFRGGYADRLPNSSEFGKLKPSSTSETKNGIIRPQLIFLIISIINAK